MVILDSVSTKRRFCLFSGITGVLGVLLLGTSFVVVASPPPGAGGAELALFAVQHRTGILWGAWLQAVGTAAILTFALSLVQICGATRRFSGWITLCGASALLSVCLIEVICYMAATNANTPDTRFVSLDLIHAVQHLYFIVAAPGVLLPLGTVLLRSKALPKVFGYVAFLLAAIFVVFGAAYQTVPILPDAVTALASLQAIWWLGAAITIAVRQSPISMLVWDS